MISVVGRGGGNLSQYLRVTSINVGGRAVAVPGITTSNPEKLPTQSEPALSYSLAETLPRRRPLATTGGINCSHQIRMAHTDIKIPDFSNYRRASTVDLSVPNRETADDRRAFAYAVTAATGVGITFMAKEAVRTALGILSPAKDVLAMAKVEVNLADIPEGKNIVIKWRGKPLFVKHRTQDEIKSVRSVDVSQLRDPQRDEDRTLNPNFLVVIGVCTHLGCVPIANAGEFGGYYCPCHGSHYDSSGRIRKGPAPYNLEVPDHEYQGDMLIVG